jgi:DNA repair photolyase
LHGEKPLFTKTSRFALDQDSVDGFVFWTRRLGTFMDILDRLADRGTPFVIQFTITDYPRALEPAVVDWRRGVEEIQEVARRHGPNVVVWRYDPVFISDLTPAAFHVEQVSRLAERLAGATDEMVVSFAQIYRKTRRNTDRAAEKHSFDWSDPLDDAKRRLLENLGKIATARGIRPSLCSQPDLLPLGYHAARCVDLNRLSEIAGVDSPGRSKGNRLICLCAGSRDIDAYDTCPHGCVYCYAVNSQDIAKTRLRAHDPATEMLAS